MSNYQWKPLTDEKKFEDLVNDLCSKKYGLEFQIYGRKGQKQHGIDGYAWIKDNEFILHQCKNKLLTRADSSILNELLNDLEKETESMSKEFVDNKKYSIKTFIFANSFKRDTSLQNRANSLSQKYNIRILVWSWDDISDMLEMYESVSSKYYDSKNEEGQWIETKNYVEKIDNSAGGIINFYSSNTQKKPKPSDREIQNAPETLALKVLLKNMPIEQLKVKAYKYLPISYFASLPDTVEEIIDKLLTISMVKEGCVPIISLFEKHPNPIVIDFVNYLKKTKFYEIKNFTCSENPDVEDLSLLINIYPKDGTNKFEIETWRYANKKTQIAFPEILIDLDDSDDLAKFLDKIYDYLEEARAIYKSTLCIELILPNERVYENLKSWKDSQGMSMIRTYHCIHRLQSRFLKPDNNWKNKWEALEKERVNMVKHTKFIEGFSYNNELSNANYKVVLKERIDNENFLFLDMKRFGIPILLSSLSKECNVKEIKDFEFKGCQKEICNHIMDNHDNEKSNIFFMVDDPTKIPKELKNKEQNLYDW